MPRRNNRKIPRNEGELGFDPSQYIGKGNTPFPDNYGLDIRPHDFDSVNAIFNSANDTNFSNIMSQMEATPTDTSTAASTPCKTEYVRNDTKTKRKKKRPYQYRYYKARRPTKRIHRAYAMIRKLRRGADQVIEALRAEEALRAVEAEEAVEAGSTTVGSNTDEPNTVRSNSTTATHLAPPSQNKQTLFSKIQKILHSHK